MSKGNEVWGKRLKEARLARGLSQKQLGILAGLDPFVASTRINRYELGIHRADSNISTKLAEVLGIPLAYFYTDDDRLAEFILIYHQLPLKAKSALLKTAQKLIRNE